MPLRRTPSVKLDIDISETVTASEVLEGAELDPINPRFTVTVSEGHKATYIPEGAAAANLISGEAQLLYEEG